MARLRPETSFLRGCRRICVRPKLEKHLGNEEDDSTVLKGIHCSYAPLFTTNVCIVTKTQVLFIAPWVSIAQKFALGVL